MTEQSQQAWEPEVHNLSHESPERRREIASMGGKAAHAAGRVHKWTCEEARVAGRKGRAALRRKREEETQQRLQKLRQPGQR